MTNVVFAADERYLPFYLVTLIGIATHADAHAGVQVVVPTSINRGVVDFFRRGSRALGVEPNFAAVSGVAELNRSGLVKGRGHVSTFTYAKLLLPEALPQIDEALYLDADTLIRGDIRSLMSWDLDHPIGAVRELGDNGRALFGRADVPYFNAGVLRLSLARLRDEGLADAASRFLRSKPSLFFQDQDVWNWLFRDRHDPLPLNFNFFDSLSRYALPPWALIDDPAIVHFVGASKPWHSDSRSRFAREWRQVHAEILGYTGNRRDDYIRGGVNSWQELVHDSMVRFRHSRPGSAIRTRLPIGAKRVLNDVVESVVPRGTPFRRDWEHALYCQVPELLSRVSLDLDMDQAAIAPEVQWSAIELYPTVIGGQPQSTEGRLLMILSSPRSGTNALTSTLQASLSDIYREGELFGGFLHEDRRAGVLADFPIIRGFEGPLLSRTAAQREEEKAGRRAVFNSTAFELLSRLMEGRDGVTLIKVFDGHLDRHVLQEIIQLFAPRVIVLRRQILFSLVSLLKAESSLSFLNSDSTNTPFGLTTKRALDYIRDTDEWFGWVYSVLSGLGVPYANVTYADEVEKACDATLAAFLGDWGYMVDSKLGPPRPATLRQDARTDTGLTALMEQVMTLDVPISDLLRLPGQVRTSLFDGGDLRFDLP